MSKNDNGLFVKYSVNTTITQFVSLGIYAITTILLARILGPENRGKLALVILIPTLSVTFGRVGIGHAVNFFASKISKNKLIFNTLLVFTVLSCLLVVFALIFAFLFKEIFFKGIENYLIVYISFFIPFYLFYSHFISVLQGLYQINPRNMIIITQSVLYLAILIIMIVFGYFTVLGAVTAYVISYIAADVMTARFLFKDYKFNTDDLDTSFIKSLLNFGLKSHIGNVLKDLSYRGDILIINYFLTPEYVAYYLIAVVVAEVIWKIPDSVGNILLAHVSSLSKEDSAQFTPRVCRMVLLPVLIISLIELILGSKIIIWFFGEEYSPSIKVIFLLLPGVLSFSIWKILINDIVAQGNPLTYSMSSAVCLIMMLSFDIFLIPKYGIYGAAVASSIAYFTATVFIIIFYIRLTNNSLKAILLPTKNDFNVAYNLIREKVG